MHLHEIYVHDEAIPVRVFSVGCPAVKAVIVVHDKRGIHAPVWLVFAQSHRE